jgi:octopine/nopaline transport system permease protein
MDFQLILDALPKLLAAVNKTLLLASVSVFIGFFLAVPVALLRLSKGSILSSLAYGYIYIFRSTPLLVQLFLIYYGSGQFRGFFESIGLWGLLRDAWFCAILALTLNTAAYTAEIIRGGIQAVPWGQIEAARSIGMSRFLQFRRIVFPIAIRQALPAYGNEIMLMVKSTSLASTITIIEVTGTAKQLISDTYRPVEVFLVAGAIYLTINFVISRAILLIEAWLNPHLRSRYDLTASLSAPTS